MTAPPREGGFGRLAGRLVLAVLLAAALARLLGVEAVPVAVWAAALTPLLYLPAYPLAYVAARALAWPRLALALALVVAHLCWLAPVLLPASPRARPADRGQRLRLLTANLFQRNPRINEMIAAVRAADADIVVLQEFTPAHRRAFERAGFARGYPYLLLDPRPGPVGSAVFSRYPLSEAQMWHAAG